MEPWDHGVRLVTRHLSHDRHFEPNLDHHSSQMCHHDRLRGLQSALTFTHCHFRQV